MANVPTDVNSIVTSDCAWERGQWVGSAQEDSALLDDVLSLPDHSNDWARGHVAAKERCVRWCLGHALFALDSLDQTWEEWLASEISVVLLDVLLGSVDHLQTDQLVTSSLKSANDLANESSLDL